LIESYSESYIELSKGNINNAVI